MSAGYTYLGKTLAISTDYRVRTRNTEAIIAAGKATVATKKGASSGSAKIIL